MKNITALNRSVFILALVVCFGLGSAAQNLTVRQIMAEPSIAGMRPEGEKLSPDGTKVIYLWNADGRPQRDLYLVPATGGTPTVILRSSELPAPTRPPERENKLDYGLEVRDEFVKARENQLGNFEWSPDSKKLVFTYGGDLYVLTFEPGSATASEQQRRLWNGYAATLMRRTDLSPNIVQAAKNTGVQEAEIYQELAASRVRLLDSINALTDSNAPQQYESLQKAVRIANSQFEASLSRLLGLQETYPHLQSNESFQKLLFELAGIENRINVARSDYEQLAPKHQIRRYTRTQGAETSARFLDNDRIIYSQGGHTFVLNTADASLIQLTREANPQANLSVGSVVPNKAGTMIAYVVSNSSKFRQLVVPNFLPEYVSGGGPRRGWSEQKLFVTLADGSRDTPFEIKLPKAEGVSNFRRIVWNADGSGLIVDRVDKDTKRRQLYFVYNPGTKDEQIILITEETDDKWQAPLSGIFDANPIEPSQLFYASERDGYNHLYLVTVNTGASGNVAVKQLTKGNWQVEWAKWAADGDQIVFTSTQAGTAERRFYSIYPEIGEKKQLPTGENGMRNSPQLDEKNTHPMLLFGYSRWNQPEDLYIQKVCPNCSTQTAPVRLTHTAPDSFAKRPWSVPKFIDINSRDGKKIPAKIYLPAGHNPNAKTKYPMVIFVHGAGYLQNVINGWNNYYREFMFNDLLTRKGYVVLDIDYRGSAGYGREWRTDVYDFLGGKDFDDHIDSIDHMVKNYAVDQKRIGAYGGSYGGFMAAMLAARAPERIAAAAALRPVMDWKNYYAANPGYTAQRLGFPDKNPEAYKRSSPITYADKLERPLLILHGMVDDNVHVQDSVQMIEKLIRLGKTQYFEAMLYPSENHGFVRPESWADEYERILIFFERHLK